MTATVDAPSQAGYHGTVHHLYLFKFYFPEVILNILFIGHYYCICDITVLELSSFCYVLTFSCTKRAHTKCGKHVTIINLLFMSVSLRHRCDQLIPIVLNCYISRLGS